MPVYNLALFCFSGIFAPCIILLLLKEILFSEFIDRHCSCYALCGGSKIKVSPMLHNSAFILDGSFESMSSYMFVFNIKYSLSPCKGCQSYCIFQYLS